MSVVSLAYAAGAVCTVFHRHYFRIEASVVTRQVQANYSG
jgi:hypothetical protein